MSKKQNSYTHALCNTFTLVSNNQFSGIVDVEGKQHSEIFSAHKTEPAMRLIVFIVFP